MHLENDYQKVYYIFQYCLFTGTTEMIRESHTTNKIITPSLVQLPGKICWLEFSIMLIICCKNKDLCEFLHRFLVLILMQIPVKSVTHIYT